MSQAEELLIGLKREEEEIQFVRFSNQTAWEIGQLLHDQAQKLGKSISIDISRNGQCLFHHAMEGTAIDNAEWIRRKNNVVNRFAKSSYHIGTRLRSEGKTMEEKYGISSRDYAAHGGAFPLIIKGVGPVGTITVSGLPQKEDHELVVNTLRTYLFNQQK